MGVSRGSFYWHFADISAFHAALLQHWREIATEQIIATLESGSSKGEHLPSSCTGVHRKVELGECGPHLGHAQSRGA